MAQGMNWGIFSLLGFIGLVLGGVIAFFVYLARRAAAVAAQAAEPLLPLMDIEHGLE
jgi:heme/copper-type cytochrome/quinol oxidase subunit 2